MHHPEDRQCQMNDAEVMTTACVASLFFRGNHESARTMLQQHGYIPHMLSKSRFSRRLHRIKAIFIVLFNLLAQIWKTLNKEAIYVLPDGSIIYADKAYNDYEIEDLLKEVDHIQLIPMRKKNSKRALPPSISFVQSYHRKRVETTGSLIEQLLPKSIHAVTSQGFELKVALFVIASSLNCYLNL